MIGYGLMWIAIASAVIVGLVVTKNSNCLWALLIGTLVSYKSGCKKKYKVKRGETKKDEGSV